VGTSFEEFLPVLVAMHEAVESFRTHMGLQTENDEGYFVRWSTRGAHDTDWHADGTETGDDRERAIIVALNLPIMHTVFKTNDGRTKTSCGGGVGSATYFDKNELHRAPNEDEYVKVRESCGFVVTPPNRSAFATHPRFTLLCRFYYPPGPLPASYDETRRAERFRA
jgi:hypothetical protein